MFDLHVAYLPWYRSEVQVCLLSMNPSPIKEITALSVSLTPRPGHTCSDPRTAMNRHRFGFGRDIISSNAPDTFKVIAKHTAVLILHASMTQFQLCCLDQILNPNTHQYIGSILCHHYEFWSFHVSARWAPSLHIFCALMMNSLEIEVSPTRFRTNAPVLYFIYAR